VPGRPLDRSSRLIKYESLLPLLRDRRDHGVSAIREHRRIKEQQYSVNHCGGARHAGKCGLRGCMSFVTARDFVVNVLVRR
jgi:hypothetical protein